jgi:hypothetical protein
MTRWRLIFALLLALLIVTYGAGRVSALCGASYDVWPPEWYYRYPLVFRGVAENVGWDPLLRYTVTYRVQEVWKGPNVTTIRVHVSPIGFLVGSMFEDGLADFFDAENPSAPYIVVARANLDGIYPPGGCTGLPPSDVPGTPSVPQPGLLDSLRTLPGWMVVFVAIASAALWARLWLRRNPVDIERIRRARRAVVVGGALGGAVMGVAWAAWGYGPFTLSLIAVVVEGGLSVLLWVGVVVVLLALGLGVGAASGWILGRVFSPALGIALDAAPHGALRRRGAIPGAAIGLVGAWAWVDGLYYAPAFAMAMLAGAAGGVFASDRFSRGAVNCVTNAMPVAGRGSDEAEYTKPQPDQLASGQEAP